MGRRSTGRIELRQNCIRLRFTVDGERQNEPLDLPPTPTNKKAAERLLRDVQNAIAANVYRRSDFFGDGAKPEANKTFREFATDWLETLVLERSTVRSYRTALNATWLPALGDKRLKSIRKSDILKVIKDRMRDPADPAPAGSARGRTSIEKPGKPISPKTMNNHLIALRAVFALADDDGLLDKNPCENIGNKKVQAPEPDPFTREEMEMILGSMRQHYAEQVANYFEFAFCTGARPSELIALRWGDVDWIKRVVRIERAMVDARMKGTKTNKVRYVDLSDRALAVLTRQKAHTFLKSTDGSGEIFHNPRTGRRWPDEQIQREDFFIPTLRRLGLRHRDAYQCRHTFATLLLMAEGRINPAYISRQLGHSNAKMLFERYSKWIEFGDDGREARKLNDAFAVPATPAGRAANE